MDHSTYIGVISFDRNNTWVYPSDNSTLAYSDWGSCKDCGACVVLFYPDEHPGWNGYPCNAETIYVCELLRGQVN